MNKLIIDGRMRNIEKDRLKSLGYDLIELEKSPDVYDEISAHPDIFFSVINLKNERLLIVEPSRFNKVNFQNNSEVNIIKGTLNIGHSYPEDIKYNVCFLGNYAIHNFKYTDEKVLEMILKNDLEKIQVSQGYTNCSIAVVDERSIITEDKGIYKKLKNYDLDILLIEKENISLPGDSTKKGFIGGTISRVDDYMIITGDIKMLKEYEKIKDFIDKRKLKIIDFPEEKIIDYGSIIKI